MVFILEKPLLKHLNATLLTKSMGVQNIVLTHGDLLSFLAPEGFRGSFQTHGF